MRLKEQPEDEPGDDTPNDYDDERWDRPDAAGDDPDYYTLGGES